MSEHLYLLAQGRRIHPSIKTWITATSNSEARRTAHVLEWVDRVGDKIKVAAIDVDERLNLFSR